MLGPCNRRRTFRCDVNPPVTNPGRRKGLNEDCDALKAWTFVAGAFRYKYNYPRSMALFYLYRGTKLCDCLICVLVCYSTKEKLSPFYCCCRIGASYRRQQHTHYDHQLIHSWDKTCAGYPKTWKPSRNKQLHVLPTKKNRYSLRGEPHCCKGCTSLLPLFYQISATPKGLCVNRNKAMMTSSPSTITPTRRRQTHSPCCWGNVTRGCDLVEQPCSWRENSTSHRRATGRM